VPEGPAQILAIAQQLHRNERPRLASFKTLLKWFGAKRRGANVISNIEGALRSAGLATNPDLAQADYDDHLTFLWCGREGILARFVPLTLHNRALATFSSREKDQCMRPCL
jgi:hypothetical protein